MNDVCLQCHERAEEKHRVWLPNVATHFGSVACTACHAPAARRDFVVRIIDTDSGQPVPLDAFGGTERPDLLALLSNADEGRRDLAFWGAMASALGEQYGRSYHIRMELREGRAAHETGEWEDAHRKCEACHEGDLGYLQRVFRPPSR